MEKKLTQIHVMDHSGHRTIAEFDSSNAQEVEVAQEKLTEFLNKCVKDYGSEPPVWSKRFGVDEFDQLIDPRKANLLNVEEVLLQFPLVGG